MIRPIVLYPDPVLLQVCEPVTKEQFGSEWLNGLLADLWDTLSAHKNGIGLSACQIGVPVRVAVVNTGRQIELINPELIVEKHSLTGQEGCLSFPNIYADVVRPTYCRINNCHRTGERFDVVSRELQAVCVLHEMDHMDGRFFFDYLPGWHKESLIGAFKKQQKREGRMPKRKVAA